MYTHVNFDNGCTELQFITYKIKNQKVLIKIYLIKI